MCNVCGKCKKGDKVKIIGSKFSGEMGASLDLEKYIGQCGIITMSKGDGMCRVRLSSGDEVNIWNSQLNKN